MAKRRSESSGMRLNKAVTSRGGRKLCLARCIEITIEIAIRIALHLWCRCHTGRFTTKRPFSYVSHAKINQTWQFNVFPISLTRMCHRGIRSVHLCTSILVIWITIAIIVPWCRSRGHCMSNIGVHCLSWVLWRAVCHRTIVWALVRLLISNIVAWIPCLLLSYILHSNVIWREMRFGGWGWICVEGIERVVLGVVVALRRSISRNNKEKVDLYKSKKSKRQEIPMTYVEKAQNQPQTRHRAYPNPREDVAEKFSFSCRTC